MKFMEESLDSTEKQEIEGFEWELEELKQEFLGIKKESFTASSWLKDEIKRLWFYNWDESWENINFNVDNIKKYLESIKNKSWSDLEVKSSTLDKWIRIIAIQLAINYINMKNWWTNDIELIDGIRGNQTWRWVKEFQIKYGLKGKDGLPWHETITKILELLPNNEWRSNQNDNDRERDTWENGTEGNVWEAEEYIEKQDFLESRLNNSDIDDSKCLSLFKNFKIDGVDNKWRSIRNRRWHDFEKKLNDKSTDEWGLESIILQNPEIWNLLSAIVSHQSKEIENMKTRYMTKKPADVANIPEEMDKNPDETDENHNENNEEISKSREEYESENSSLDSFEDFILSEEWIAIIIDEIKSHIDTSHENENGEYDRLNGEYPFSLTNLEVRLKNARKDKMHWDYYAKTYNSDKLEEVAKMHILSNQITWYVNKLVWNYTKSNGEIFNQDMVGALEWFLSEWIYGVGLIEMFSGKGDEDLRDIFKWVLSDAIKSYEWFVRNENDEFILNTWDVQADLQLKSYLYLYWRIFYSELFKANKEPKYYEDILPEVMKIIISNDDKSLISKIKHKEFLVAEKKLEGERKKRDLRRRQEAARINRERNERFQSMQKVDKRGNISEIETNYIDPNKATWPELAAEANLWKDLDDYELDIEESEHKQERRKETAFREAWKDFIQSNDDIKPLITQEQMRRLFDINSNTIIISEWERFKESNPLLKDVPSDKVEEIHTKLSGFSSYFNDAEQKLSENSSEMEVKVNETVKTYAIWAVIDNVRDTFDAITGWQSWDFKWFQLNKENPVKKEWNNIIISGLFNGTEIKVRYNLKTGELFMNSFVHRLSPDKISIWKTSSLDYPIGTIKPFNDVLNDYYKLPTNSHSQEREDKRVLPHNWGKHWVGPKDHPRNHGKDVPWNSLAPNESHQHKPTGWSIGPEIPKINENNASSRKQETEKVLNSQIDLIGQAIKDNTESQAQKNSAIIGFLKTFNVTSTESSFSSWEFNRWSNLFDIIEIIENTWNIKNGDIQSLEYFNNEFMPTVMEYSWLKWWTRNEYQDTNNKKAEKIFNYDGDNEKIKFFRDKINNFNPKQFSWIANFDSSYQLWFIDFIKEENLKFITWNWPNWILNISQMREFIKDLETIDKEADIKLEEELADVN